MYINFLHRVCFQSNSLDCHLKCRKVEIGFGKKMRIKHNIRYITFTPYSKKKCTGSNKGNPVPLPVKLCFPQSSVTFDIDFCWVIFAVQLLLWFLFCLSVFSNFELLLQLTAQSAKLLFNGLFFVTLLFGGLLITYNATAWFFLFYFSSYFFAFEEFEDNYTDSGSVLMFSTRKFTPAVGTGTSDFIL